VSSLKKSPDSGGVGYANRRALLEGDLFGERMDLRLAAQGLLGIGAAEASGHIDAVTGLGALYAFSHAEDFARAIHARGIGKRRFHGVGSGAYVSLNRVYARGMNANHYLARAGTEVWSIFQDQLFRTAKLTNTYCFHVSPSLSRVCEIVFPATAAWAGWGDSRVTSNADDALAT
jgi:hypothetical protein